MKKLSITIALLLPVLAVAAPKAPSELVLTPEQNAVRINWGDNAYHEVGYKIFRDGQLIHTTKANVQEYIDRDITPNQTYQYEVKSYGDDFRVEKSENTLRLIGLGSPESVISSVDINFNEEWRYKRIKDIIYIFPVNSDESDFNTLAYRIENNRLNYLGAEKYDAINRDAFIADHLESSYFDRYVVTHITRNYHKTSHLYFAQDNGQLAIHTYKDLGWIGSVMSDEFDNEIALLRDTQNAKIVAVKVNGENAELKEFHFDRDEELAIDDTIVNLSGNRVIVQTVQGFDGYNAYVLEIQKDGEIKKLSKKLFATGNEPYLRRLDYNLIAYRHDDTIDLYKINDAGEMVLLKEGFNKSIRIFSHKANELIAAGRSPDNKGELYVLKIVGDSIEVVQEFSGLGYDAFEDTKSHKFFFYDPTNGKLTMFDKVVDANGNTTLDKVATTIVYNEEDDGGRYGDISRVKMQDGFLITYQGATGPRFNREAPISYKASIYKVNPNTNEITLAKHDAYVYSDYASTEPHKVPNSILDTYRDN